MSKKHLSPNAAAKITGISRSSIMRALSDKSLFATRDNRNRWLIDLKDLEKWADDRVVSNEYSRTVTEHVQDMSRDHVEIKIKLAASETKVEQLTERLDEARADNAKLLNMITDLSKPFWARIWNSRK